MLRSPFYRQFPRVGTDLIKPILRVYAFIKMCFKIYYYVVNIPNYFVAGESILLKSRSRILMCHHRSPGGCSSVKTCCYSYIVKGMIFLPDF